MNDQPKPQNGMAHLHDFKRSAQNGRGEMRKDVENDSGRIAIPSKKSRAELDLLSECNQLALEEEQRKGARDRYAEIRRVLSALKFEVTLLWKKLAAGKKVPAQTIHEEFTSISKRIHQVTQSVREISARLNPETLEELGILEAIRGLAAEFE